MDFPNVRLKSKVYGTDGSWFCEPGDKKMLARIKKTLAECRALEPAAGWYLETCGTEAGWRRVDDAGEAFMFIWV